MYLQLNGIFNVDKKCKQFATGAQDHVTDS